ncbi:MAG: thioredoxin [Gemmatimonadetes bacterium]|nr:MAG: thioredoxin [Gemmatimonadota bacterium]
MWPDERVVRFVNQDFLPARVHVKDDAAEFKRYGERYNAPWTPTILELDAEGVERHRVEGFLPADDLLAQLTLGLTQMAFQQQRWADAERGFREVVQQFPYTDAAPEALYWAGVARYKATGDAAALQDTARTFTQQYQDSTWAKKASVWR